MTAKVFPATTLTVPAIPADTKPDTEAIEELVTILGVPKKTFATLEDIETVDLTVPAPPPPPSETVLVIFTLPNLPF